MAADCPITTIFQYVDEPDTAPQNISFSLAKKTTSVNLMAKFPFGTAQRDNIVVKLSPQAVTESCSYLLAMLATNVFYIP